MNKFKVGDWVKSYYSDGKTNDLFSLKQVEYVCDDSIQFTDTTYRYLKNANLELWEPQEGEWCVFKNNEENSATIAQYGSSRLTWNGYYNGDYIGTCEPFIGSLPSFIKD